MACVRKQKAAAKGEGRIGEQYPEAAVAEKKVVLVGEGGEGREAAAKSGHKQQALGRRHGLSFLEKTEQHSIYKAADEVY